MLRPLALLLLAALALAACGTDAPVDPDQTVVVPEADVERFRADVFQETLDIDAALARLEGEAAGADSVVQAAYDPVLERLREQRRRFQVRVDSLRPAPRAAFDSTQTAILVQARGLREAVRRGRYDAAPSYAALQAAAGRGIAEVDERLVALRPYAAADTTGRFGRALDSLAADRDRLRERLRAYPDTSAAQFPPFRGAFTDRALDLDARVDSAATDTVGVDLGAGR
ncbi:hypothetical protein RQM47_04780 [Rubrivirga sp. S365]|uniref:Lipoprotein n=1 Tax=Rubrivirga litoralis TaxID=3075598 RepID=A0ABU3BPZ0_9BACT|nr:MULTISPECIES: hypothetical protein [unclassified Rubrivirga]MDT0631357.1 hypothetical protein [Rubrivirga sp. F394]MDT7855948.1 hypothetical protein [Rubrivirga sp. S365]